MQGNDDDEEMFWDYPKAGKAGAATTAAASKANGAAQKPNGVQAADGAFGTTMSPEFKVRLPRAHFALLMTACWRLIAHARPAICMVREQGAQQFCVSSLKRVTTPPGTHSHEQGSRWNIANTNGCGMQEWCRQQMLKLSNKDDLTLVEFLMSCQSSGETAEYISAYLGKSSDVASFTAEFIRRKAAQLSGGKSVGFSCAVQFMG